MEQTCFLKVGIFAYLLDRFGSVDIVMVKGELMVLEINIGVMMDNLIDQGKENLAYDVSANGA